ncbi:MAG: phosphoribosyl-AMP cyclohydrolase [Flaviflexus sp.]|nr:phosphoribosyl-AMP cyclohydrolase [Flaviflexus sp.]
MSTEEANLAELSLTDDGLIPVIVQDATSREVLMMAWMDEEALRRSLTTGRAWYWSRSRQTYWRKGDTSGHIQRVRSIAADCDRDCLLMEVDQTGPACHTGAVSCFFRPLKDPSCEN